MAASCPGVAGGRAAVFKLMGRHRFPGSCGWSGGPQLFYAALPRRDFSPPFRLRVPLFPFCIPATPFRRALALHSVFFCLYFTGCCFLHLFWEGRTQLIVATVPHCGMPDRKTALCSLQRCPQSLSGRPSRRAGIIYSSYFIKKFMQNVFFHLFSSVCASDKWRFFTEKLFCLRFAFPANWRFVTEKI